MKLSLSGKMWRLLCTGLLPLALLIAAEPVRTVIIVRHAERSGGIAPEVGISEAGRCRATVLAGMLADANVKVIYTSEVARTQQTAEPLAQKLGIQPEAVAAKDIDALAAKLRSGAPEGTRLVVGHSNTIPAIIERLTGEMGPPIGDSEYDRMFVLTIVSSTQAKLIMLRYPGCAQYAVH